MEFPEIKIEDNLSLIGGYRVIVNQIVLTQNSTEGLIERIINHETIHALLNDLFDKTVCSTFDNLFNDKEDLYGTYGLCGEPTKITGSLTKE